MENTKAEHTRKLRYKRPALKGIGNAVVPYRVYPIMQVIFDIEMQEKA